MRAACARGDVVDEVAGQLKAVVLDRRQALLLGVGVCGLLLGVGGQYVGLIARQVSGAEIASQAGGYVDVVNLVPGIVVVDPNHPVLGLTVLVLAQDDAGHVSTPSVSGIAIR